MLLLDIGKLILAIAVAFLIGKLVSKLKLPSILGWLISGMILGPHAIGLLNDSLLNAEWYTVTESILECTVGLMIGTELIWRQMKKAGKQIVVTTITESLGTFLVVSLVFGVIFYVTGIPLYLAVMFGGIALATAPAPSLSIVRDMHASGPVTKTLIPLAALDDLVGALVFFLVIALVSAHISTAGVPVGIVMFLIFLPVLIGIVTGFHRQADPSHENFARCTRHHGYHAAGNSRHWIFDQQHTAHAGAQFPAARHGVFHPRRQHGFFHTA